MSFELLDTVGGRLVIRRPDATTYFDSAWRVPAQLGEIAPTRAVEISAVPGEQIRGESSGGQLRYRYILPANTVRNIDVDLGAVPGGITPNYVLANIKARRIPRFAGDTYGVLFNISLQQIIPQDVWLPINASSVWLERLTGGSNDRDIGQRIGSIMVTGTVPRFVFRIKESARTIRSNDFGTAIRNGSRSKWQFDFKIAWGVYDL